MSIEVKPITKDLAQRVIAAKHYSRRLGIFWEGFGLYVDGELRGVVCYGQPSAPIQKHAFKDRDFRLYELTRLVVDRGVANGASILIGRSLRMLKEKKCAVISYADTAHGHSGIVYQATNWLYTGANYAHDTLYIVDGVPTHPMTLRDKLGVLNPTEWARENNIERAVKQKKHRYFYFVGTKADKKIMRQKLTYAAESSYPKSEKSLYDDGLSISKLLGIPQSGSLLTLISKLDAAIRANNEARSV